MALVAFANPPPLGPHAFAPAGGELAYVLRNLHEVAGRGAHDIARRRALLERAIDGVRVLAHHGSAGSVLVAALHGLRVTDGTGAAGLRGDGEQCKGDGEEELHGCCG